jgi:hypothetical protein
MIANYPKKAYKTICAILKKCKGKSAALTNNQIQQVVAYKTGIWLADTEVRNIIHEIRINHDVTNLIACGNGYYTTKDKEEIKRYKNALIKRAYMIFSVAGSFEK